MFALRIKFFYKNTSCLQGPIKFKCHLFYHLKVCGDYCKTTKVNYIEILEFTHFVKIFQFDGNGTNYRNKQLIERVKVSIVVDFVSGNTCDNEDES